MSVTVSHMPAAFALAEDFYSLDHWHQYGNTDREYRLRTDASVEQGNALEIGGSGELRIARDTDLVPGLPATIVYRVFALADGRGPCQVQIRNLSGHSGWANVVQASQEGFRTGWNHVIAQVTPPADWEGVRIACFASSGIGGMIAAMRGYPTPQDEEG